MHHATAVVVASLVSATLGAQDWVRQQPSLLPPAAYGPRMAYDAQRAQMVLFGGFSAPPQSWPPAAAFAQTWVLQSGAWSQRAPAVSPPARGHHAMAFDAFANRVVLFGGIDGNGSPLNDLWQWDGTTWSHTYHSYAPAPRGYPAMAYSNGWGIVVFGGFSPPFTYFGDTWAWDPLGGWTQLATTGPAPRGSAAMAAARFFAPQSTTPRSGLVLHGGRNQAQPNLADTWLLPDGSFAWQHLPNAGGPLREEHGMAFDPRSGQTFLASGHYVPGTASGFANDLWRFDGSRWFQLPTTTRPLDTIGAAVAMDAARDRLVLFGGGTGAGLYTVSAEHWEFGTTYPLQRFGAPCSNAGAGVMMAVGLASRDSTWRVQLGSTSSFVNDFSYALFVLGLGNTAWNGLSLPQSLAPAGLPACQLLVEPMVSLFQPWPTGWFVYPEVAVAIPDSPALFGVELFVQGLAGRASGLAAASDGARVVVW